MNQEASIRLCYGSNILQIYTEMFEFLLQLLLNGSILSLQTNILCILCDLVELWLYSFYFSSCNISVKLQDLVLKPLQLEFFPCNLSWLS